MPETVAELVAQLTEVTARGWRGRLLDRGLARSVLWRSGQLPLEATPFSPELTDDLLDYGHALLAKALRLRDLDRQQPILNRAFLVAGEAIESAVHRAESSPEEAFHRVTAACAFHLAHYTARSYSILPPTLGELNASPSERCLAHLLRRALRQLRATFSSWLLDPANSDDSVAERLAARAISAEDAMNVVLTTAFMRALAWFEHALDVGSTDSATVGVQLLRLGAATAAEHALVPTWWLQTLAAHLFDELWSQSLHVGLPLLPTGPDAERWMDLRDRYIRVARSRERAEIELWPSQVEAARRSTDPADSLVLALPTSAGKTRIAELCVLRTLASGRRAVYVTPLRALSAQVERGLAATFNPLGFSVSSLYGAAGMEAGDFDTLGNRHVVVSTPEKLDFALRNSPQLLDDVGIVVLDEGHMIGPEEREVRYEALVQRLLRRPDAASRRLTCLSALFPESDRFKDFVSWLRRDVPGDAVRSHWRPTRQRFGVITWRGDHARLDLTVDQETPWVERYIEAKPPVKGTRRRKAFPQNKNELTLASAWTACEDRKQVMVYCTLRRSVEVLARLAIELEQKALLPSLLEKHEAIAYAKRIGTEWLGPNHPAVDCLRIGIAVHHGGLPRPFLAEVERLLREGICRIAIASPTLAQGLNVSASSLLIPSIWRARNVIPPEEFTNVAGRAGRAYVDVDGVILHVVHEEDAKRGMYARRDWERLVAAAKGRELTSGILALVMELLSRLHSRVGGSLDELLAYVTSHAAIWDYHSTGEDDTLSPSQWERRLAALDSAILGLVEDLATDELLLPTALDEVLKGSLWERHNSHNPDVHQKLARAVIHQRAKFIWQQSTPAQRRGYFRAGLGAAAGGFLDREGAALVERLADAEDNLLTGERDAAAAKLAEVAAEVWKVSPFQPYPELPNFGEILIHWLSGDPMSAMALGDSDDVTDFIQDGIVYRLTWALEALRVWALETELPRSAEIKGVAALCCEAGTLNLSAALLVRSGLDSRTAALEAAERGAALFVDVEGMNSWLHSEVVQDVSSEADWPSAESHEAWKRFLAGTRRQRYRKWISRIRKARVAWANGAAAPAAGAELRIARDAAGALRVYSPDFQAVASLLDPYSDPSVGVVRVRRSADADRVDIEVFGPA